VPDCNSFLAYACSMVENNITDAKYSGPWESLAFVGDVRDLSHHFIIFSQKRDTENIRLIIVLMTVHGHESPSAP
jgi:hypothetical protein